MTYSSTICGLLTGMRQHRIMECYLKLLLINQSIKIFLEWPK